LKPRKIQEEGRTSRP